MPSEHKPTVFLSGSSGLIGTSLASALVAAGILPLRLVRRGPSNPDELRWNPTAVQPVADGDLARLEDAAAAVHLCGANVAARRWTASYKELLVESRVGSTRALVGTLGRLTHPPRVLIVASAVGIYGDRGDELLNESADPGVGFLAGLCCDLENEAMRAGEFGVRVVPLRIGMVLARNGGALLHMLPVFRAGFGGRLGSGRQWMSWIALRDLSRAAIHVLNTESLSGPVNMVTPVPVTIREFTVELGRALHRPALLPVPAFALRMLRGEMADELLLSSARVIPERLTSSGFRFDFPEIAGALRSLL